MRISNFALVVAMTGAVQLGVSFPVQAQEIAPAISTSAVSSDGILKTESRFGEKSPAAHQPSRVIVRFKIGAPTFLPGSGRAIELSRERNTHVVINPPGLSVRDAIARYRQNPNVIFAEPDYIVQAIGTSTPNDGLLAQQWDMTKISAPAVWASPPNTTDMVVAVIDTGIDFTHSDLAANLYTDAINSSIHGYTCIGGSCVAGGSDDYGHGTHVAGTIGAIGNNGIGVAGINWSTKLLSIKFLDSNGSGAISDAVLGFNQILALKKRATYPVNIRVTNNSWGGGGYSQALKDAMLAVENEGILDVCAAGNSNVNADTSPMYPGAYDNRGIVSVLASDSTDLGASFTNYGVASVDIAAPGVNILSTAALGTCGLCDSVTGYRTLSGTSMASPHVAGAAVAMLAAYPNLTPAQARDAILSPLSYDTLTDDKARRTSSGGRLNIQKLLANAAQFQTSMNYQLNQFPSVTVGPDAFVAPSGGVSFTQTVADSDDANPNLRVSIGRGPVSNWTAWLFGWRANLVFPATTPFSAPNLARVAAMPYDTSVSDNRGGGAMARNWAVVTPPTTLAPIPAPVLSLTQSTVAVGSTVAIGVNAPNTAWDINVSGAGGSSGWCCYTGNAVSITFDKAGTYLITSQAIDAQLNTSPTAGTLLTVGSSAGIPPTSSFTLDKKSGTAPLVVGVNASASSDTDGTISYYYYDCGVGYAAGQTSSRSSCTFTQPGTYWTRVLVTDNTGMMGVSSDYVVVTPPQPGSDTTPPSVSISSPTSNATIVTPTPIQVSASDAAGIKKVDCLIDGSTACGSVSGPGPFSFQFDPAALNTYGPHIITATATDNSGLSASANVSVTTQAPTLPTITLSPSSTTVQRNKSKIFTATLSNTPTYGISRVDFLVQKNGINFATGSDASTPFTYSFLAGSGTYTLKATPYDNAPSGAKAGTPSTITIIVK